MTTTTHDATPHLRGDDERWRDERRAGSGIGLFAAMMVGDSRHVVDRDRRRRGLTNEL